jgi:transcription initiation factor TFIIE subunit alpha
LRRAKTRKKSSGETPPARDGEVKELVDAVCGDHGHVVISALMERELTDEGLARLTGLKVNVVRRILYDLYERRLVNYRRTRDDGTGWYVYHWYVEPKRAMEGLEIHRRQTLEKLKERLEYEKNTLFFRCSNNCPKVPMDAAIELNFTCPTCGERLEHYDNTPVVKSLEERIRLLEGLKSDTSIAS